MKHYAIKKVSKKIVPEKNGLSNQSYFQHHFVIRHLDPAPKNQPARVG